MQNICSCQITIDETIIIKKTKLDINPTLTLARIQILSTRDRTFDKFIPTVFASPSFWFC